VTSAVRCPLFQGTNCEGCAEAARRQSLRSPQADTLGGPENSESPLVGEPSKPLYAAPKDTTLRFSWAADRSWWAPLVPATDASASAYRTS